ncbi:MAG: hypothetical protein GY754_01790 [bacterium]|nr:hypothetical protein [bacterium]
MFPLTLIRNYQSNFCPEKYCFYWLTESSSSGTVQSNFNAVSASFEQIQNKKCLCPNGSCTRLDPINGDSDWYMPCEPVLTQDGLPWFFFMNKSGKKVEQVS